MRVDLQAILSSVEGYYTGKLRDHGPTPKGVDWNSAESQARRFQELLRVCPAEVDFSLNDYGCGYGALLDHLRAGGWRGLYRGFDISPEMMAEARRLHGADAACELVSNLSLLQPADYTVASGIFNVRLETEDVDWEAYMQATLVRIDALSLRGFAFNALTRYSDPSRRRPDLYYADPLRLFDTCKRMFSPYVSLIHDYPLYEFTILVTKAE